MRIENKSNDDLERRQSLVAFQKEKVVFRKEKQLTKYEIKLAELRLKRKEIDFKRQKNKLQKKGMLTWENDKRIVEDSLKLCKFK